MFQDPSITNKSTPKNKPHTQDSIPSFIRKTYDILEESKFPDIIDWNPEGTALVIKKPTDFCQKVLPQYFKHNNLTSFVRQLNMYNFHKRRTQNIDHVYAHELFQKGKKHLLKEIRRKNHENSSTNNSTTSFEKTPLILPDANQPNDINTIAYENQFLKKLYNDAMSKLSALEAQVKDLSSQNQSLWSQLYQQKENNAPNTNQAQSMTIQREASELTLEKLPMTFGGISIPPLKLNLDNIMAQPATLNMAKIPSMNVSGFFSLAEESTEPNESSFTSPSVQNTQEVENSSDVLSAFRMPSAALTSQANQIQQVKSENELKISRQDMSIGQLLNSWNVEVGGESVTNLLGKREPTETPSENPFDGIVEPTLKRGELSIFNKKGFLSNLSNGFFNVNDDFGMDLLTFTN